MCKSPGEMEGIRQRVRVTCKNSRCSWYETPWIIELRDDGTVFEGDANQ